MRGKFWRNRLINKICLVFLIGMLFSLAGCSETKVMLSETESEEITDSSTIPEIESPEPEELREYDSYLRKIWVEESWSGGDYTGKVSFYFTKIEDGQIEGKIMLGEIAEPEYVLYRNQEDILRHDCAEMYELYGNIVAGFGQCTYQKNKLQIQFQQDGKLLIDSEKTLRPYCLSDIDGYIEKDYSCAFSNEVWDGCFFTVIQTQNDDGKCPDAYLLDEENNILYHFDSLYQTDSEVRSVQIEDVNTDGLMDISLVTDYADDDLEPIERVFLQNEDSTFQEEILRSYQPAGQGIFYGNFDEVAEQSDFALYEELAYELQEAIQNQTIDSILQNGADRLRRLSEHEVRSLKYLDLSGNLGNYTYVYNMQYIRDGFLEWYVLEQNEGRVDVWVQEGNAYTFYGGDCLEKGRLKTGLGIPLGEADELYFLEFEGLYYPCTPKRNDAGNIESVNFYTFETPTINGGCMVIRSDDIALLGYSG